MRLVNDIGLNPVIFRATQKDSYNAGKSDATATSLIKPPRIRILEKRHRDNLVVPVSRRKGAFLGTVIHKVLELAEVPNVIKEQRLYAEIDGWIVSAQYDLLRLDNGVLSDYKSMLVWKFMKDRREEYEQQVNMQAWLLAHGRDEAGNRVAYNVERIEAVAVLLDWSEKKARQDPKYPRSWAPTIPLALWPAHQTEAWIRERVALHKAAEALPDDQLPPCSDEDRWMGDTWYAVTKPGAVKAMKVVPTLAEAEAWLAENPKRAAGAVIEERAGEPTRCLGWCPAAGVCNQFKATAPLGAEAML